MEGEKDFDEEPVDALVSHLIRRGDTYKGKFKKLENAVATGKTITTTTSTKLITVPKTAAGKVNTPVVKVPSTGQMVTRTVKMSPQTSVMKVIPGKNPSKRTAPRGIKGTQVSGFNQYRLSENTRSQTKDRRRHATQTAVTSYEKVVVDAITLDSESKGADEDVNQDLSWKWADTIHTQDIGRVSHIFHLEDLLTQDVTNTILVNTNVCNC